MYKRTQIHFLYSHAFIVVQLYILNNKSKQMSNYSISNKENRIGLEISEKRQVMNDDSCLHF